MNKKYLKRIAIVALIIAVVGSAIAVIGYQGQSSEFSYQGDPYSCSKEIDGTNTVFGFRPSNQQEFSKYCRIYGDFGGFPKECEGGNAPTYCATIEYRAVLDILRRPDVAETIAKYPTTMASVKALGHRYIHDKDFLKRILPAYSNMNIDCIIVVHSPEGTRFFIENGDVHKSHDDHQYQEVSSQEFLSSLNNAPDEDINNFWLGLH